MRWLPLWGKAAAPVRPEALPPGLFSSPAAETVPSIPPPPPRDWLIELDLSAKVLPESATIRTGTTAPDTATSGTAPIGTAPVRFPVDRLWCSPGGGEAVVVLASLPSYQRCRLDLTLCANSVMTATVTVNAVPVTRLLVEKVSCFSFMLPFFGIAAGSSLDIAIRFSDHRDPRLDRNVAGLMPLRHLCVHGINAPASSFAAAPGLLSDDPGPDPASLSPRDLLMRFMSLGDNCELGIAQRQYGAEPLDLYRFSGVPLGWILEAVDRRFEGIGAASDDAFYLEPLPKPDGRKYWFAYQLTYMIPHETGLVEAAATRERLAEKTLVRFERLGQKLLEDLEGGRRIAVLGDMLELGQRSAELHAALADEVVAAGFDLVLAAGPMMRALADALAGRVETGWRETAADLRPLVLDSVGAGDVVVVKGSNGSRMASIVAALKEGHERAKASPAVPGAGEGPRAAGPHPDVAPAASGSA